MPIARESLLTLEAYAKARTAFRERVIAHKKSRTVRIGENITLIFEDELTIRYQVQEMLRIERIFEDAAIADELATYNPLVPDGSNWKATMLIEYPEVEERKRMLALLKGVEDATWVHIEGGARVYAIADEDLERENEEKTSSVHFLRFELDADMKRRFAAGAALTIGIQHSSYTHAIGPEIGCKIRASLLQDLKLS